MVRHRTRASSPLVIGEPALVRVNAIGKPKIVQIAEQTGAGLVTVSNLYAYGRVVGPMTEDQPLVPNGHKGDNTAVQSIDGVKAGFPLDSVRTSTPSI